MSIAASDAAGGTDGVHVLVSGRVQGVGFRYFVKHAADSQAVAGWVRNLRDGRVEAVLFGAAQNVQQVLDEIGRGPRNARVDEVVTRIARDDERTGASRPLKVRTSA